MELDDSLGDEYSRFSGDENQEDYRLVCGIERIKVMESIEELTTKNHYILWSKTFRPRVKRDYNVFLSFFVVLSIFSYMTVFVAAAANLFLNIFFAIYGARLNMSRTQSFFFAIAAFWLGIKFAKVFIILFCDMWRYISLAWGSKYDERLQEFLWEMIVHEKSERAPDKSFEGWWRRSLTAHKRVSICCFKFQRGNVFRLFYCFLVILIIPVVYGLHYGIDTGDSGPTALLQSYCMSLLLVAFIYLTVAWIYHYFVLISVLRAKLKVEYMIESNWSCYAVRIWLFWLFWDNLYVSREYRHWKSSWTKVLMLVIDLGFAPCFITGMFCTRGISKDAIAVCLLLPVTQYVLNVLNSFRKDLTKRDTQFLRITTTHNMIVEPENCCKYIGAKLFLHRKTICIVFCLIMLFSTAVELGYLIFTSEPAKLSLTESTAYAICNVNFAFGLDTLGPTEMALLAELSYKEEDLANQSLTYFLGAENYIWVDTNETFTDYEANFYHIKAVNKTPSSFDHTNGDVVENWVVIRGTTPSLGDALQDMTLWSEISSFQIINLIIPLLVFWPINLTCNLVYILSMLQGWIGGKVAMKNYLDEVSDYVNNILPPWRTYINNTKGNTDVVKMIGHSLGGGLANLVASKEYGQYMDYGVPPRTTSFGVSPVGTAYSSKKFGFTWEAVTATETSVWAARDIVPLVDHHMGLYEVIPCTQESFLQCHSVLTTLCQLWRQCTLPTAALRQAQKTNFLNCMCCSDQGAEYCTPSVNGGAMWNRSCATTS